MRINLAQQCLALCKAVPAVAAPTSQDAGIRPPQQCGTDAQQAVAAAGWLRMQVVLGLTAEQAQQHADLQASCSSQDPGVRREALLTLAQLVSQQPVAALQQQGVDVLWDILQQALSWPRGVDDPSLLSAALQLAGALACLTYTSLPSATSSLPGPAYQDAVHHMQGVLKRRRLAQQQEAGQQQQQQIPSFYSLAGAQCQKPPVSHGQEVNMPGDQTITTEQQAPHMLSFDVPHGMTAQPASPLAQPAPPLVQPAQTLAPPPSQQQPLPQAVPQAEQYATHHAVRLTQEHAVSLHRCLVGWCAHWHPRVKCTALRGLFSAHTGLADMHDASCGSGIKKTSASSHLAQVAEASPPPSLSTGCSTQHRQEDPPSGKLVYLCAALPLLEQAYSAAITALADDHTGVRSCAAQLMAALARAQPSLHLPGPRWQQLGHSQALKDDAFQRLCACVGDEEPAVRALALRLISGLPCCSLRVKLQALSKKATITVATPAPTPPAPPAQGGQRRGQGPAQRDRGKGRAGPAAGQGRGGRAGEGSGDGAGAWCGAPGAKGLPLLDASVGALVHGTEDEDWMVRTATAAALLAVSMQEVQQLLSRSQSDAGSSGKDDVGSRRQVMAQCIEYLCDLLQDEWDEVRLCAVQALTHLLSVATQQPEAAVEPPASSSSTTQPAGPPATLDRDQVFAVLGCLNDPCMRVRQQVQQLLGVLPHLSLAQLKALVTAVVQAAAAYPGQEAQQLLEVVKKVAAKVPGTAKTVATAIAKKQQQQVQQQQQGVDMPQSAGGDTAWLGQVSRQHLLVMKALVLGAGGLL